MCGIAGIWDPMQREDELLNTLLRMTDCMKHRGPDDQGRWIDPGSRVGLGHKRLSIIDLSPAGHQPMVSPSGRYCIVLNGEIYNFQALRQTLGGLGHSFRGHSDTEALLTAIDAWGVEGCLERLNGMFAFGVWDAVDRVLYLARDRLGEKPLYYGWAGNAFLFASELKAFAAVPAFARQLDRRSVAAYFQCGYVPAPLAIYRDTWKLRPGHFIALSEAQLRSRDLTSTCYWDLTRIAQEGQQHPFTGSVQEAVDHLATLLRESVRLRMIADVPLGAFLSGGLDSSTIVALMQAESSRPVRTFTIGFAEPEHDEALFARRVARHLGTDHTEITIGPEQAMAVIPQLPTLYDEPFADSSAIPTFLVSRMARQHVKVGLSGDGGDEVFSGYTRYTDCERLWHLRRLVPLRIPARRPAGLRTGHWNRWRRKWDTLRELLSIGSGCELYTRQSSVWQPHDQVVIGASENGTGCPARPWPSALSFRRQMMLADTVTYLPDDILVKLDRASMGASVEVRAPMLDHRLVEFAWSLPTSMLVRRGITKWPIRQVLRRYLPEDYVARSKRGFAIPRNRWLRGPLRDWADSLLQTSRLKNGGYLNPLPIAQHWEEHRGGRENWATQIWTVLMFEAWLDTRGSDAEAGRGMGLTGRVSDMSTP